MNIAEILLTWHEKIINQPFNQICWIWSNFSHSQSMPIHMDSCDTLKNILSANQLFLLIDMERKTGFSKCAADRRFRRLISHSRRLKLYQACVFQQFLCLCELSLSRFVDLYLLIDYFYYCNQPNTNKSTIF